VLGLSLTKNQKIFANEYLIDRNATRAYKAAYPNCKKDITARVNGSKALTNTNIANYIEQRMKDREKRTEITQDMVLKELAKLGFFDPRKLFHPDGKPKDITELDDDTAACIAGLEVLEQYEGNGDNREYVGYVKKYKLTDKKGSLELLGRHLGMFKDKVEVSGSMEMQMSLLDDMIQQMRGDPHE